MGTYKINKSGKSLYKEVMQLKNDLGRLMNQLKEKSFYNPWELTKTNNSSMKIIWRYNRVYYRNLRLLYEVVKPDIGYVTFVKYLKDPGRIDWMFGYEIQPVFVLPIEPTNYLICSDGELLSSSSLTVRSRPLNGSYVYIVLNGERVSANLADLMWQAFVDEDALPDSYYFMDGDYRNCALNNLELKTPKLGE